MKLHAAPHPPEGADHGVVAAPVAAGPVLAGAHEVLAAPVVGVLVEDPVALHDVAGEDVVVVVAVVHVGAVLHELHHLAHHLRPVVHPHPVGAPVLWGRRGREGVTLAPSLVAFANIYDVLQILNY